MKSGIVLMAGLATGALALGGCASHQANAGRLNAVMLNGGGNVSGSGKRVCIKKSKTGTHIAHFYCMTAAQYKQYQKDQEIEQEKWQQKQLKHDGTGGGGGPAS